MNDRAYILLIIFLIAMGFVSYQKALNDQGGITLLDKFMHGKELDLQEEDAALDTTLDYFKYDQRIDELTDQVSALGDKREILLNDDAATIASTMELNAELGAQLLSLARSIKAQYSQLTGPSERALVLEQALSYLQDLDELNGIIDNELEFFLMNMRGSDYQLNESVAFLDEKIEKLVDKVDELDLKVLASLLRDFNNLDFEMHKIKQNLQEHIQYLMQKVKTIRGVSGQILDMLVELDATIAGDLSANYRQIDGALTERLNQAAKSTLSLLQLYEEQMVLMYDMVDSTAGHKHIDLVAFKEELGIAVSADPAAPTTPQAALAQGVVVSGQVPSAPSSGMDIEELKMRQKKDEELLNTMLKVYGP